MTAGLCFALAAVWLLAPGILLWMWSIPDAPPVDLVGRRSGALFLGLGVILHAARAAEDGVARRALSRGIAVACGALAGLGLFELARGRAGGGILSAVAVELLLAIAFVALRESPPRRSETPRARRSWRAVQHDRHRCTARAVRPGV